MLISTCALSLSSTCTSLGVVLVLYWRRLLRTDVAMRDVRTLLKRATRSRDFPWTNSSGAFVGTTFEREDQIAAVCNITCRVDASIGLCLHDQVAGWKVETLRLHVQQIFEGWNFGMRNVKVEKIENEFLRRERTSERTSSCSKSN